MVFHLPTGVSETFDYLDSLGVGIVIRNPKATSILQKVMSVEKELDKRNFATLMGAADHFGKHTEGILTTSWDGYVTTKDDVHNIKYYLNKRLESCGYAWIQLSDIPRNRPSIPLHKVFIPAAGGSGSDSIILGNPFYGEPGSICSQTYLIIGYDPQRHNFSKEECENIITYLKTRFLRYLVSVRKKTQHNQSDVFQFVPLQNWNKPWTDEELYLKYHLSTDEIQYIESMIKPMPGESLFVEEDVQINENLGMFNLLEHGVNIGDRIIYTPAEMEVTVVSEDSVEYEGDTYKLNEFTAKFMPRNKRSKSGLCQGPKYFSFKGVSLYKLKESFLGGEIK